MKKIIAILIIIIIAQLIAVSALGFVYYQIKKTNPAWDKVEFQIKIQDIDINNESVVQALKFYQQKSPVIKNQGNSIIYQRSEEHNCREIKLEKETKGNVIKIYEVMTGPACLCRCGSQMTMLIKNLPTGIYQVNIYQAGTEYKLDQAAGHEEPIEPKKIKSKWIWVR